MVVHKVYVGWPVELCRHSIPAGILRGKKLGGGHAATTFLRMTHRYLHRHGLVMPEMSTSIGQRFAHTHPMMCWRAVGGEAGSYHHAGLPRGGA